jgi:hypothetical protein
MGKKTQQQHMYSTDILLPKNQYTDQLQTVDLGETKQPSGNTLLPRVSNMYTTSNQYPNLTHNKHWYRIRIRVFLRHTVRCIRTKYCWSLIRGVLYCLLITALLVYGVCTYNTKETTHTEDEDTFHSYTLDQTGQDNYQVNSALLDLFLTQHIDTICTCSTDVGTKWNHLAVRTKNRIVHYTNIKVYYTSQSVGGIPVLVRVESVKERVMVCTSGTTRQRFQWLDKQRWTHVVLEYTNIMDMNRYNTSLRYNLAYCAQHFSDYILANHGSC